MAFLAWSQMRLQTVVAILMILAFAMWTGAHPGLTDRLVTLLPGLGLLIWVVHRPFVGLLGYIFLLAVYPRARILVGPNIPLYLTDILIGTMLTSLVLRRAPASRKHDQVSWLQRTPVDKLVLGFALSVIPAFVRLVYLAPSFVPETIYFLGRYWLNILIFFCFTQLVTTRHRLNDVIRMVYYSTIVASIWALLQGIPALTTIGDALTAQVNSFFRLDYSLSPHYGLNRATGGYNIPTAFGGYYAVVMPLLLFAFSVKQAPRVKIPAWLGMPIILAGFLFTYTRHAWVAAAVGIVAVGVLRWRQQIRRFISVTALTVTLALGIAFQLAPGSQDLVAERAEAFFSPLSTRNIQARIEGHPRFFRAIAHDPMILVWGQSLRIRDLQERGKLLSLSYEGFVSDSWALIILDSGLLSFLLFSSIYLVTLLHIRKSLSSVIDKKYPQGVLPGLLAALIASGMAHLGDNYFAVQIFMRGLHFALLGLSLAAFNISEKSNRRNVCKCA